MAKTLNQNNLKFINISTKSIDVVSGSFYQTQHNVYNIGHFNTTLNNTSK